MKGRIAYQLTLRVSNHNIARASFNAAGEPCRRWDKECVRAEVTIGDSVVEVAVSLDAMKKLACKAARNASRKAIRGGMEARCIGPARNPRTIALARDELEPSPKIEV